jgi:hypothetical protein
MDEPEVYLSICSIYRDEAPYLPEWIEFHKLVGVERIFLMNNLSTDNHREVLAPYIEEGTVIVEDWEGERPDLPRQAQCNWHCLQQHRHETRWLAFIDVDEFLFSPTGRPVPEILPEYEYAAALWVTVPMFGSSGHRTKPAGLVTESYTRRHSAFYGENEEPVTVRKRIVDPRRTIREGMGDAYGGAPQVNTNHDPVTRPRGTALFDKLQINHYYTKSEEEAAAKGFRLRPSDGKEHTDLQKRLDKTLVLLDEVTDTSILQYVPALRAALERRQGAAAAEGDELSRA